MRPIKFGMALVAFLLFSALYGKITTPRREIALEAIEVPIEGITIEGDTLQAETTLPKHELKTRLWLNRRIPISTQEIRKPMEELIHPYKLLTVTITAYCPCPSCCGIWSAQHESRIGTDYVQKTSSGTIPTAGRTIATDPSVIPAGSKVVIDGHTYVAEDTGGGIKGNRIDIYFDTHQEALNWGVQTKEVKVYAD